MVSFTIISTLIASAAALGINCRGSGGCPLNDASLGDIKTQLQQLQAQGKGGKNYGSGVQLACTSGKYAYICAFYQNGNGGTVDNAVNLVQGLMDHGCSQCGSNPTDGKDVGNGELTVNIVGNPCCHGTCACPLP
ncbi:hypothetical protein PT974_09138 [Cladobotryum mycophilum]|uniref:Killer toxin Kp4 domain-containing protein n=1 Tax=Cladobotryum mycophilum TaxID=491253 RepID=A0ABR0SFC0_9HYPO